jgi:RNA polymerase sigma-70 factor (ECF subfamily)
LIAARLRDHDEIPEGRMIPSSQNEQSRLRPPTGAWFWRRKAPHRQHGRRSKNFLCRTYWRPIYGFVRREGTKPEEAKDVIQGFFALILQRKDFQSVRKEKGRLRSFLLASLKHLMANERRDAAAIKRGGGQVLIPLDEIGPDDAGEFDRSDTLSADLLYDRRWALSMSPFKLEYCTKILQRLRPQRGDKMAQLGSFTVRSVI